MPVNAVLLLLLIGTLVYHSQLGVQVVVEDYVHHHGLKIVTMLLLNFVARGARRARRSSRCCASRSEARGMSAYQFIDHSYDVVVVGAGGAGLRATFGLAHSGLSTACITKVFPTRSHTVAAQGGISAALGNMGEDDWRWHMYDTVKGSDWLGDQDAIEFMCKEAPDAVIELEHYGVPFSRTDDGRIYQRPFGGMTTHYGKGTAQRTCAAADRTGHAMLHTLYQQALRHEAQFFIEYFAIDLIMENGECRGVVAINMADGTLHRFRAHQTILATGGYGRAYFSCTSAHTCTGDGGGMVLRAGLPLQDMEFVQFHPTGIYGAGCLITEGVRGEGGILRNSAGERFMERYAPNAKDLASRDVVSRAMTIEIREGRGVGEHKDHIFLHLEHLGAEVIHERLPGIAETAKIFAGVDVTKQPIPVLPTVHYNMGGIPANYHGEVVTLKNGDAGKRRAGPDGGRRGGVRLGARREPPGLEFAARSRRVRSRGRAALRRDASSRARSTGRWRRTRATSPSAASIGCATPRARCGTAQIRLDMQRVMQTHAAVFRTGESLRRRRAQAGRSGRRRSPTSSVSDRSLIWNTDLIETLELDNLLGQAVATIHSAVEPQGEPRRARARGLPGARRRELDEAHARRGSTSAAQVRLDYRPVHLNTLTSDVEPIPPKARTY